MGVRLPALSRLALALPLLCACLAPPPDVAIHGALGVVRADSQEEALALEAHLASLGTALTAHVPGACLPEELEVWVQDEPRLYHTGLGSNAEAEGLYAPFHERILLSRHAADLERVLAHELTHAALDGTWSPLSGTLEEGLCDVVATALVPEQAARLRAGRLSSAALACGGLRLRVDVRDGRAREGVRLGWSATLRLTSQDQTPTDPLDTFRVRAGLSSSRLQASVKRGYYGLAFLVAERIGLRELHDLCTQARAEGLRHLPHSWLLEAAALDEDPETWRVAAADALGGEELRELVRLYPGVIAGALAHHLRRQPGTPRERWQALEGSLQVLGGDATVDLRTVPELRAEVLARL